VDKRCAFSYPLTSDANRIRRVRRELVVLAFEQSYNGTVEYIHSWNYLHCSTPHDTDSRWRLIVLVC